MPVRVFVFSASSTSQTQINPVSAAAELLAPEHRKNPAESYAGSITVFLKGMSSWPPRGSQAGLHVSYKLPFLSQTGILVCKSLSVGKGAPLSPVLCILMACTKKQNICREMACRSSHFLQGFLKVTTVYMVNMNEVSSSIRREHFPKGTASHGCLVMLGTTREAILRVQGLFLLPHREKEGSRHPDSWIWGLSIKAGAK